MTTRNQKLARLIHQKGLTYDQAAELANVGRATIARALRGDRLRGTTIWAISTALGHQPHDLGFEVA